MESGRAATGSDVALTPVAGVRPQTLLLTFLGFALFGRGTAVVAASYVQVMERLGISEQATRSTLVRMVNRGLLSRHRKGRHTYFGLTPRSVTVLADGARRLWETGATNRNGDNQWTLLGFSLPESRRDDRHLIRSQLRWAGFGLLRSGLWMAPGTMDVAAILPDRRLLDYVLAFRAEPIAPTDIDQMVREAYDLPAISLRYQEFLRRWDRPEPLPAAPDDLARVLWLLSEWLLLLRDDPRIPLGNLPADWPAVPAEEVFHRCHARLEPAARRIVAAFLDAIEVSPTRSESGPGDTRSNAPATDRDAPLA
jgi:phenylacetic acid degradation operon negative regulatory protein